MPRTCWIVLQAGEQSVSALYQLSTRPIIPDMELAKLETWLPYASIPFSMFFFLGVHQAKALETAFHKALHGCFSFSLMGQGKPIQTNRC